MGHIISIQGLSLAMVLTFAVEAAAHAAGGATSLANDPAFFCRVGRGANGLVSYEHCAAGDLIRVHGSHAHLVCDLAQGAMDLDGNAADVVCIYRGSARQVRGQSPGKR